MHLPDEGPLDYKFVAADPTRAVVVEQIVPGTDPDYCVHGRTRCMRCDHWCWLSPDTFPIVSSGSATPLCVECAIVAGLHEKGTYLGRAGDL